MDRWDPPFYERVFVVGEAPLAAVVEQTGPPEAPRLSVELRGSDVGRRAEQQVAAVLRTALGLEVDLGPFYRLAHRDDRLAALARRFAGLKPPVMPTVFETVVSGIACQQLSLIAGMHLLARLARAYGAPLAGRHAFPRPTDLLTVSPEGLRALGFSLRKSRTILWLAHEEAAGRLDLEGLRQLDTQEAIGRLVELPGIGRWTAEYVALRGLGRLEAFPVDDVGAQNKLQRVLGLAQRPDAGETERIVERWHPYQGLLYFHLLLDSLDAGGAPTPVSDRSSRPPAKS